jgi:hypothetical protein
MHPNHFPPTRSVTASTLSKLPLPRAPAGYAVQRLDTDQVLDRRAANNFCRCAARTWMHCSQLRRSPCRSLPLGNGNCDDPAEHHLAIVPAGYDSF